MVAWLLDKVLQILEKLPPRRRTELKTLLNLSDQELQRW